MTIRSVLAAAFVAAAAAACGGGGGGYTTGTNMNSGGGGGGGGTTPMSGSVTVQDFSFSPMTTTVSVGSAVTWSNVGAALHHPVADSGSFDVGDLAPAQTGAYGTGTGTGGTGSVTFSTPGTYAYHCSIHPQMTGTITVTP